MADKTQLDETKITRKIYSVLLITLALVLVVAAFVRVPNVRQELDAKPSEAGGLGGLGGGGVSGPWYPSVDGDNVCDENETEVTSPKDCKDNYFEINGNKKYLLGIYSAKENWGGVDLLKQIFADLSICYVKITSEGEPELEQNPEMLSFIKWFIKNAGSGGYPPPLNKKTAIEIDRYAVKTQNYAVINKQVNYFKDDIYNSLYFWYAADEPISHPEKFNLAGDEKNYEVMRKVYQAIKNADNRPVMITFEANANTTWASVFDNWMATENTLPMDDDKNPSRTFDVLGVDCYASSDKTIPPRWKLCTDAVRWALEESQKSARPFISVTQAFGPHWNDSWEWSLQETRWPTYEEFRYFSFLPIVKNASGNIYWTSYHWLNWDIAWIEGVNYSPDFMIKNITNQINELSNTIASRRKDGLVICKNCDGIEYILRKNPSASSLSDEYILIAVNTQDKIVQPTFVFSNKVKPIYAKTLYEEGDPHNEINPDYKSWFLSNNSISDKLNAHDVRVYKISTAFTTGSGINNGGGLGW